jgi:hypothetical protein
MVVLLLGLGSVPADVTVDVDVNLPAFEFLATGTTISIHRPVLDASGPRVGTLHVILGQDTLHWLVLIVMPLKVQGLLEQVTVEMVALALPSTTPLGTFENVVVTITSSAIAELKLVIAAP